jgi:site-specific recombinase XerD
MLTSRNIHIFIQYTTMNNDLMLNEFVDFLNANNKTNSTIIAYKKDVEQLAETNAKKALIEYTELDIAHAIDYFINVKGLTRKTASRKLNSIRAFYKYLVDKRIIKVNPSLKVTHPKYRLNKPRVLRPTEYLALKEVSRDNKRLYAMIEILLQTGIRIGELSRLKVKNVNFSHNPCQLFIEKFDSTPERRINLSEKAEICLRRYMQDQDITDPERPLFTTKKGTAIQIRNVRNSIDIALNKAKIKNACVNDLRNTFILHQLSSGVSIKTIASYVGHKNEVTTLRYIKLLKKKYKPNGADRIREL